MVAFTIYGFPIYRYWIFYALAFVFGYLWWMWIGKKGWFKEYPKVQYFLTDGLEDLLFSIAVGVILWGRLWHAFIYNHNYYLQHLIEVFQIWKWGMSFIGGILGVVVCMGSYLRSQKASRKDMLILFDLILAFVPLGIFLWRFWNYLNQELYGIPVSLLPERFATTLKSLHLVHVYPNVDHFLRVNTNFLSMIFEWAILYVIQCCFFVKMIHKKSFKIWVMSTNFLLFYSLIRFFLEYLRADSQSEFVGIFTKSQRFFITFFIIAIIIKIYLSKQEKNKNLHIPLS